jgi:c-di-GMP-binding flagellar brake protein YcgR
MSWDSEERRHFVRVKYPCEISIYGSKRVTIPAQTENISAGGIRVLLDKKLPVSSIIELDIYGIKEKPIVCKGRILWVFTRKNLYRDGELRYDTGIEFHDIPEKDVEEIKNLVSEIASGRKKA